MLTDCPALAKRIVIVEAPTGYGVGDGSGVGDWVSVAPLVGVGVSNVAIDELVTVRVSTGVLTIVMPGHRASERDAS